ncbi:hypothetical protein C8R46DRAFT_1062049 [Mycena filopes]|nr:hypothetical protein C8R46DRAFT_1062049 [Mycena filopes]
MKLPQELIDLIIGEIFAHKDPDPFLDWRQRSPLNIYTLKSCSLLSRACVRQAQKQLFFALRFRPGRSTDERLPKLLSAPHICPYIKDLDLTYYAEGAAPLLQFCSKSLPNLQAISLHFAAGEWALHSVNDQLLAPLLATLRLPGLRCIQLSGPLNLGHAGQLYNLLKGTVGLKQLALKSVGSFRRQVIDAPVARRTKPVIVLDSLRLTDSGLSFADVDSMLEAFTAIDISHLRRLEISRSAGGNLLRVSAGTLQEVEIYWDPHLRVTPYRDAPIGAQKLRSITVTASTPFDVFSTLKFLGPLADMAVLEKVKITIRNRLESYEPIWAILDATLSSAPRLRVVEMVVPRETRGGSVDVFRALDSSGWRSPPGAGKDVPFPDYFDDKTSIPSRWLVGLAQKGILHIIST